MRASFTAFALAFSLSCGSGYTPVHVELSGKTAAEGGAAAARAYCSREARCGRPRITCEGGGPADGGATMTCTGTIVPVAFDGCFEDARGDIAELLACPALSAEQIDLLELCFDDLVAKACVSQREADARARAAESGTQPPEDEPPPSCALLVDPPPACR